MQIGSSVGTAVLNTVAVDATRDFVGAPTAALVHGFATATGGAAVALVVGAALVVAFLRPAAPAHHHNPGGSAMSVELNHTLVHSKDTWAAAREVAGVLGLAEPTSYGPFAVLQLDNGASLDFIEDTGEIQAQHYAFLVGEDDFDAIWGRIREQGRQFWADPFKRQPGRDQPRGRRPRALLGGSGRPLAGDHHPSLRQRRQPEARSHDRTAAPPLPARPLPRHHRRGLRVDPADDDRAGDHLPLRRHLRVPRHRRPDRDDVRALPVDLRAGRVRARTRTSTARSPSRSTCSAARCSSTTATGWKTGTPGDFFFVPEGGLHGFQRRRPLLDAADVHPRARRGRTTSRRSPAWPRTR